ncbi:hypothetical protein L3X38_042392 [Prunus dulcis]|uniref:Uncharacterized protein n=1 Tax=Prunus dulcis TaxID=3755 RepID=A0AAD4UV36_PRUDU|nr:hypothetical protein L3X38_042392 [Prunus dulcis]
MWVSILISRDLPYGLMVNKGNNYLCGGELYYPAAAGYQLSFIQSIPIEDRIFKHCPCAMVYQQEKEKKKAQEKADNAEKENPPTEIIERERESSANPSNANPRQGEKWPKAPIQGSPWPAEHPSSSHSIEAVHSATTSSFTP